MCLFFAVDRPREINNRAACELGVSESDIEVDPDISVERQAVTGEASVDRFEGRGIGRVGNGRRYLRRPADEGIAAEFVRRFDGRCAVVGRERASVDLLVDFENGPVVIYPCDVKERRCERFARDDTAALGSGSINGIILVFKGIFKLDICIAAARI